MPSGLSSGLWDTQHRLRAGPFCHSIQGYLMITFTRVGMFSWNCFTRGFEMWVGTAYVQWSDDIKSCTPFVEFIFGKTRVAATSAAVLRALLTRARTSDAPCVACSAGLPAAPVFSDRVPMRSWTYKIFVHDAYAHARCRNIFHVVF